MTKLEGNGGVSWTVGSPHEVWRRVNTQEVAHAMGLPSWR